jgi:alpha-tubulin suppressor-like RCC1 family protein
MCCRYRIVSRKLLALSVMFLTLCRVEQARAASIGTPVACGANAYAQLGDGTQVNRTAPVQVSVVSGIAAISPGAWHTLALANDGSVWSWGRNFEGQLGDGTSVPLRYLPKRVNGLSNVVAISGAGMLSLTLAGDGRVWTWGINSDGELGDGTTVNHLTPAPVVGLSGVTAISGGYYHSVARKNDGTAWTWGWNYYGQLGDGTTIRRLLPTQVRGLTGVTAVAGGYYHSIALKNDGTVWCWGSNSYGQIGNNSNTALSKVPAPAAGLANVIAVAAGGEHSLALKSDGTVWAWGRNLEGQLGDGGTTSRPVPSQVSGLSGITAIAAGEYHSMALKSDGTVWCWGSNSRGQLGDGSYANNSVARPVNGLAGITAIGAGAAHSVALGQPLSPVFTIRGHVATTSGAALAGVKIACSGSSLGSTSVNTVTDTYGDYVLSGLPNGTYRVTPNRSGYIFRPALLDVTVSDAYVANRNFTATAVFKVSGSIKNSLGAGMPNMCLALGSRLANTDTNGNYVFLDVPAGTYALAPITTPANHDVTFIPASRSVTVTTANVTAQDFTITFSINGRVANSLGNGLAGIEVTRTGSGGAVSITTDTNGAYSFTAVAAGNYTIAPTIPPSLAGMSFFPASSAVAVKNVSLTNVNFTGFFTVSGRVTRSDGAGLAGVRMTLATSGSAVSVYTNANGDFTFTGVRSNNYTLTPVSSGKTFAPTSRNVAVSNSNKPLQDFVGQ